MKYTIKIWKSFKGGYIPQPPAVTDSFGNECIEFTENTTMTKAMEIARKRAQAELNSLDKNFDYRVRGVSVAILRGEELLYSLKIDHENKFRKPMWFRHKEAQR
jgi:hypothetical protein